MGNTPILDALLDMRLKLLEQNCTGPFTAKVSRKTYDRLRHELHESTVFTLTAPTRGRMEVDGIAIELDEGEEEETTQG